MYPELQNCKFSKNSAKGSKEWNGPHVKVLLPEDFSPKGKKKQNKTWTTHSESSFVIFTVLGLLENILL